MRVVYRGNIWRNIIFRLRTIAAVLLCVIITRAHKLTTRKIFDAFFFFFCRIWNVSITSFISNPIAQLGRDDTVLSARI